MTAPAIRDIKLEEVVDEETGEIIELPVGPDRLTYAIWQYEAAGQQEKAWAQRKFAYRNRVVEEQESKAAVYGDASWKRRVTIVTPHPPKSNVEGQRQWLRGEELPAEVWRAIALGATGWKLDDLEQEFGTLDSRHDKTVKRVVSELAKHITRAPSDSYIRVSPVAELRPRSAS